MSIPSSVVRVGSVPFNNNYMHTMTFASKTDQASYFASACPNTMRNSVYIRPDEGQISFEANSNELYGCNYLMFMNPENAKWWYAFIIDIQYVNDSLCRIIFEIDVMQSWYFDYQLSQCYVEREHIQVDTVGANLLDEPVSTGELKYAATDILSNTDHPSTGLTTLVPIVFTSEEPYVVDLPIPVPTWGKRVATGGWNNTIFSGCGMYVFTTGVDDEVTTFLNSLNRAGGGAAVTSIILFPLSLIPDNWPPGVNVFKTFSQAQSKQVEWNPSIEPRNTLDGYTPRNAKLYTYPYNFMRLTNFRSAYHDYRFEFFADNTQPSFNVRGTPDPGGDIMCQPKDYNGVPTNVEEQLTLGGIVQCNWTYNAYQNWLAQNAGNNLINLVSGAAMLIPAGKAIGAGVKGAMEFGGVKAVNSLPILRDMVGLTTAESASAAGGLSALANLGANVFDASQQPSKAVGTVSNATIAGIGYGTFGAFRMCVRKQFAKLIDQFFTMYGYTTQEVKVPNRTGRRNWNYVKTRNATLHGNVDSRAMAKINAIYDNGITFWHTPDVGNYDQDNSPV